MRCEICYIFQCYIEICGIFGIVVLCTVEYADELMFDVHIWCCQLTVEQNIKISAHQSLVGLKHVLLNDNML